ncbi:MAG: NAD(P)/FAD-dependent oxidoreductase [Pseudomonadota bacterium]
MTKYDVIVVGGGTSGLEAAKTASENGLRVALLERKSHPAKVQRSCAQMFLMNMDSFYNERMYFSETTKQWVFPVNNFSVSYPGTYRKFYACHFIAPNAEDRIEIGDYEANESGKGVAAVVFNKNALLEGLFEAGRQAGVDYYLERNVTSVSRVTGGVQVDTAEGDRFTGTFCIAADGINSRLARISGLNRQRTFLFTSGSVSYYVTGVQFDRSEMICMGNAYDHKGSMGSVHFCMLPSVYRDDEYWLYVNGDERLDFFTKKSKFSTWFKNTEVTHKRCAVINAWSPAPEPFKDNIVFVGDSCWFAEAENTGALLSGHRAAHAIGEALHRGKPDRQGIASYISWWKQNWAETHNYKDFLCYAVFFRIFTEDELNYLHKIITRKLFWSMNPFNLYGHIMRGVEPHVDRIRREQPELAKKLEKFTPAQAEALMKPSTRAGFPAY